MAANNGGNGTVVGQNMGPLMSASQNLATIPHLWVVVGYVLALAAVIGATCFITR